jgi:sulfoxide reductase catalytic subunit YedY
MTHIRIPKGWEIAERNTTPEAIYYRRREFLKTLALGSIGAAAFAGLSCSASDSGAKAVAAKQPARNLPDPDGPQGPYEPNAKEVQAGWVEWPAAYAALHPGTRNSRYALDRGITRESVAASHNNFYEFTTDKGRVWTLLEKFQARPWTIEITGRVEKPFTLDVETLVKRIPIEERLYRHRCVEAWAMAVPWSGLPMRDFIALAKPLGSARYLRMVSFHQPKQAPGVASQSWYPWPYFEALRLDEATNELALLGTGIYGHPLIKQHGAPLRLVTPWKYGYKSIKSIVRFEFTEKQPQTFWNQVAPDEYGFLSNVNPAAPHPRWSQAREKLIGTGREVPTQPFNGYGEYVARLYS